MRTKITAKASQTHAVRLQRGSGDESDGEPSGEHQAGHSETDNPAWTQICIPLVAGCRCSRRGDGGDQTADNWLGELGQRPQRCDTDRAGADESHLLPPDRVGVGEEIDTGSCGLQVGQNRHAAEPRDQKPGEHRHPHREPDEVPRSQQCERECDVVSADDPRAQRDIALNPSSGHTGSSEHGKAGGRQRTEDHRGEPLPCFTRLIFGLTAPAGSDLQHFGGRHALGIRQIGIRHQRPPQRDREEHPEHPATHADERRGPERKAGPPADDDQARQDENDGGERARGRRNGLDDVVFEDRRVPNQTENRHRDDGRRDRRGEGEPDSQTEIDVRGGEDRGDQDAEHQPPDRQFLWTHDRESYAIGSRVTRRARDERLLAAYRHESRQTPSDARLHPGSIPQMRPRRRPLV